MKLSELKLGRVLASYRVSAHVVSHLLGTEKNERGDTIIIHRLNDELNVRKSRVFQDKRGEHYFICYGEKLYLSDYEQPKIRMSSKPYRYH